MHVSQGYNRIKFSMVHTCLTGIRVLSRDCVILCCDSPYKVIATECLYLEVVKQVLWVCMVSAPV